MRLTDEKPLRDAAKIERARLKDLGKVPIYTSVAQALECRQLHDLVGLEKAESKFIDGNGQFDSSLTWEWWAFRWVGRLWHSYRRRSDTPKFYNRVVEMAKMDDEQRERALGLIQLETLDNR